MCVKHDPDAVFTTNTLIGLVTHADAYSVPSKQFAAEVASCESAAAWAGNTITYILCRDGTRLVTRNGCLRQNMRMSPSSTPPRQIFFFCVENKKIFVTYFEEAHNTSLKYCGINII
jgi:hypothetical protein